MSTMHDRINALLAKAEGASTDAEAAAYFAKAEELMLKYAIERADLAARDRGAKADKIGRRYLDYDTIGAAPKGFWSHLGRVGTYTIIRAMEGRVDMLLYIGHHAFWIYGAEADLDYLERMIPSVWAAAYAGLRRQRVEQPWSLWASNDKAAWDRGYLAGFCRGVAEQIRQRSEAVEQAVPGSLVRVSRSVEIRAEMHRDTTVTASRSVKVPRFGYAEGLADGARHSLTAGQIQ